jgi:PAS domain S-box-containing protein
MRILSNLPLPRVWRRSETGMAIALTLCALVLLIGLLAVIDRALSAPNRHMVASDWERHTASVMIETQRFQTALQDAEIGQRGYLLTSDPSYLTTYETGAKEARRELGSVRTFIADNPLQLRRIERLQLITDQRLSILDQTISVAKDGRVDDAIAIVRMGQGKILMDSARREIAAINAEESRLMALRQENTDTVENQIFTVNTVLAGLALLLFLGLASLLAFAFSAQIRLKAAAADRDAQLREKQARELLQSIIDSSVDPIYAKDRNGNFVVANVSTGHAYGAENRDMIGKGDADYQSADIAAKLRATDLAIMETDAPQTLDEDIIMNGNTRVFESVKVPWRVGDTVIGIIGVSRDITERRAAEDEVAALNRELEDRVAARAKEIEEAQEQIRQMQKIESIGQLTGGIAHDFNNLLAAIMSNLEILRKRVAGDARSEQLVDGAYQGAHRGATLTQRLLAFARKQTLKAESHSVERLLGGMDDLLNRSIGPNITLTTHIPSDLPPVTVDANQFELAILNLVVNARDAMETGGALLITAQAHTLKAENDIAEFGAELGNGHYVCLTISDTGSGMDDDTVKRAIEPFFTTKGIGKGTGLGLSMVYGLAKQMGGTLTIKSIVGTGTQIGLWLPRAAHIDADSIAENDPPVIVAAPVRATEHQSLTILSVDDDGLVNMGTAAMLEDLGHAVVEANSGKAALELITTQSFDLVITDQGMPDMLGTELTAQLRCDYTDLPIIIATGYQELEEMAALKVVYLSKPFTQDKLRTAVETCMQGL